MKILETLAKASAKEKILFALATLFILGSIIGAICVYSSHQNGSSSDNTLPKSEEPRIEEQAPEEHVVKEEQPTKKPSEYKFGTTYEKALKDKKPMIVLFYANWCGYCIRFMPIYEGLYKKYNKNLNFVKIDVEDEKYKDTVNDFGIMGFPTVYLIDPVYKNKSLLSNSIFSDDKKLHGEIDNFMNIHKLLNSKK